MAPQALADLLDEAKGLLAHRLSSGATLAEVIQALAEMGVEKIKKDRFGVGSKPKGRVGKVGVDKEGPTQVEADKEGPSKAGVHKKEVSKVDVEKINPVRGETESLGSREKSNICAEEFLGSAERKASDGPKVRSRHIPMAVRRAVYTRANGKCESVDEATGQRCGSAAFLELHHELAFAKGGEHTVDQIKLCCRNHNGFYAEVDFSSEWMAQFRSR